MQNDVLLESRSAALRQVLRSLECDAAAKTYLDGFVPSLPGTKPYVPVGAAEDQDGLSGYGLWKISLWAVCATL